MKLRNKKTGEIGEIGYIGSSSGGLTVSPINRVACESIASYNSLAELNEEWEDVPEEEPKLRWYIGSSGVVHKEKTTLYSEPREIIGNSFETEEEAELAVRKLKAWKRLKDKGFRFIGKTYETDKRFGSVFYKVDEDTYSEDIIKDLDLLFCTEENS